MLVGEKPVLSQAEGLGGPVFGRRVPLSQLGGQIMPTTVLQAPPDFQTLRRDDPGNHVTLGPKV